MRALMVPMGSAGDVFPFLGIGAELKRRGHTVTYLTHPPFEPHVRRLGMEFYPLELGSSYESILMDPDMWDTRKSFEFMLRRAFIPAIPEIYRFIMERFQMEEAVVIAPSMAFGARLAQEKGVHMVSLILQPLSLQTVYDTPVIPGLELLTVLPTWLKRPLFRLLDKELDRMVAPALNAFRSEIGLSPVTGIFNGWSESPECVIGLFAEWFAALQPDWPPQTRLVGFPLYDSMGEEHLPDALENFLKAGEPPLIFTGGTAMRQGRWFFEESVQACQRLGCRGVLINKSQDLIPEKLPPNIFHCDFAPFSLLFPRGKMIIHPGGIGTTAQALAAGVPQLIVPLVNDQFDQAARIKRLGAGSAIARKNFQAAFLASEIQNIFATPAIAQRAHELSQRVDGPRSIALACDLIEKMQKR